MWLQSHLSIKCGIDRQSAGGHLSRGLEQPTRRNHGVDYKDLLWVAGTWIAALSAPAAAVIAAF
jgi:hypothetical protein